MEEMRGDDAPPPEGLRRFKLRLTTLASILAMATIAVLYRYGTLMLAEQGAKPPSQTITERGPILDRNGRILAMQTKLYNVTVWKPEVTDILSLAEEAGKILGLDPTDLRGKIEQSGSDFLYIAKKVGRGESDAIRAAMEAKRLAGVGLEPVYGRVYPEKTLASKAIGFVGEDGRGLAGIEYAYQDELQGTGSDSQYGGQVVLTLDATVQRILEDIAQSTMEKNKAEGDIFIAMDPRNGDILGYVSLPDYDPNDIKGTTDLQRYDRLSVGAYEPGSVFKVFSMSSVLELGGASESDTFFCDGSYHKVLDSGEKIVIKCLGSHGHVHIKDIITYSCNAGAAYASDTVSAVDFERMIRAFGFGAKTGIGLAGETAGVLRPSSAWSGRTKQTIAMGQEIAVSALQIVQAATAIANDGLLVKPRLVSKIVASDGTVSKSFPPTTVRRVISAKVAQTMRQYMMTVVSDAGTGTRARIDDLPLAVKTGTAQLISAETGAYSTTDFIASCLALLPADKPTLVLYHVIIKPQGDSYYGGRIAAPPVREAAEALAEYLGIIRGRNQVVDHSGTLRVQAWTPVELGKVMPDLKGVAKRQLIPLLSRQDLNVEISGDGYVVRQSPDPGTPVTEGLSIRLELE